MGFFSRKYKDDRTPEDLRAIDLNQRLNIRPYNYYEVKTTLLSLAFPSSPMFGNRALISSECPSEQVRRSLEKVVDGTISMDQLVQVVFGIEKFTEFVDKIFAITQTTCSAASTTVLSDLSEHTWTTNWDLAIDTMRVDSYIWDCLGEVGARPATSSGLPNDGWSQHHPHAIHYAEAAKIGFVAVAEVFQLSESRLGLRTDQGSQRELLSVIVTPRPVVPSPLDVLSERHRKSVNSRCEQIAFRLERMFGNHAGKAVMPYTFSAASFLTSLKQAAQHGAMLAAVGIDPTACLVYRKAAGNKILLESDELTWIAK